MTKAAPPTFLEECTTIDVLGEVTWSAGSDTCICTIKGKHTHNKRRKTFVVPISDLDTVWPYATQALRVITWAEAHPKRVAEKLIAYYKAMPAGWHGPVWLGLGVLPWDAWSETCIERDYKFHPTCSIGGPAGSEHGLLSTYERNYPSLTDAWKLLDPFYFDEHELTIMLKAFLQPPLCDASFGKEARGHDVKSLLTKLHGLGMPAIFLVEALKTARTPDTAPMPLPPGITAC